MNTKDRYHNRYLSISVDTPLHALDLHGDLKEMMLAGVEAVKQVSSTWAGLSDLLTTSHLQSEGRRGRRGDGVEREAQGLD